MKRKIKLRDLTKEQYLEWYANCKVECTKCPLYGTNCCEWFDHKDLYSDKFLNQTIKIDVSDILDKKEHDYLATVIEPWRKEVKSIKRALYFGSYEYICIKFKEPNECISFPLYKRGLRYKRMKEYKEYTLEELGL